MACNTGLNTIARSVQTAYNNASQAFEVAGGTIAVLGSRICDAGCAIDTETNGFTVRREGVYRISYDVIFVGTGAGTAEVRLYNGGTALPCAYSQFVVAAGGIYPMHIETTIPLRACYGNRPFISAQISGAAGNVTHVCASVAKIA